MMIIVLMGRSLVQRCQAQFLWMMAPRDDGDDCLTFSLVDLGLDGGRDDEISIHPLLISLPRLLYFFADAMPLPRPNFYSRCCRYSMVLMVDIVVDCFGWRWRGEMMGTYIHPSIEICSPAFVFFCGCKPLSRPNLYSGWRRYAMVLMVDIAVDLFGWRWREG